MSERQLDAIMTRHLGLNEDPEPMMCKFWFLTCCLNPHCKHGHYDFYSQVPFCEHFRRDKCKHGNKCLRRHLDEFEDFPINGKAIPKSPVSSPKSSMESKAHEDSAAEARFGDAIVNSFSAAKIRCPPLNLKLKNSFDGLEVEENTQPVPPQVSIATMASPMPLQTSGKKLTNKQKQKIKVKERKQARKESRKQTAEDQTAAAHKQKASEQQAAAQRAGDKENAHEPAADVLILGKNSKEELIFLTFWTKMFCEDLEKTKELIYGFYEARGLENTLEFLNATFRGRYQTDDWRSAALAEVSAEVNGIAQKASAAVVA